MTTTYVLAPDALIDVGILCSAGVELQAMIAHLIEMATQGAVTFPPETAAECRDHAPGEPMTNWALPTLGNLTENEATSESVEEVLCECPELLDPDETELCVAVVVLALAYQLRKGGKDVCVVTNETVDGPETISITTACARFGLDCLTLPAFLHAIGRADALLT